MRRRRRRRTPDTVAPSLDGADERAILVDWLADRDLPGMDRHSYRAWRDGLEACGEYDLPADLPRLLRRWLRPRTA
jgi:hypothetical protein